MRWIIAHLSMAAAITSCKAVLVSDAGSCRNAEGAATHPGCTPDGSNSKWPSRTQQCGWRPVGRETELTHWGRDMMAAIFADDIFKGIFFNENVRIAIKISLNFVPKGPIINTPTLVQILAWRWPGDKPLSEPTMASLLMHICVTRPQWVNKTRLETK